MQYRRLLIPNATYFFTVVTHNRRSLFNNEQSVTTLKQAFQCVRAKHPIEIDAIVILPDHIHCIWTLPENDTDYATRWRLIKTWFTKHCDVALHADPGGSRESRNEKAIWQHRYWEHVIRDEKDLANHIGYIHYNPVKHGYVKSVRDWPHSSFHRYVNNGLVEAHWGAGEMDFAEAGKE